MAKPGFGDCSGAKSKTKSIVEDSLTASNIAILMLPVALALVPLGLFQDASLLVTLFFALATDVISVLPAAIKGFELIIYGTRSSYLYGGRTATDLAVAETWAAVCKIKLDRNEGTAILSTAIALMNLEIALEFIYRS